jgi:hypothetical protein
LTSKRVQQKQDRKARVEAMRAKQRAQERRGRLIWLGSGGVDVSSSSSSSGSGVTTSAEVLPPVVTGQTTVQAPAVTVANTTGISSVVAYDTTGWPSTSNNGSASGALSHTHVTGPVQYSVTPPVGQHNPEWMTCGVYDQPVPNEHAVHNLEHGAIWITYQASLPQSEVSQLRAFFARQTVLNPAGQGASRYMDLTPYPGSHVPDRRQLLGIPAPAEFTDRPRLQEFVNKFRVFQKYIPEYGAPCTGGIGTPLQQ